MTSRDHDTTQLLDHRALYEFRFAGVDAAAKRKVWQRISADLYRRAGRPGRILDPACGAGELIETIPAQERWAADVVPPPITDPAVNISVGRYQDLDFPEGHFDAVVFSNVLEHLRDPDEVQRFLQRARGQLAEGGRLVVLGPNFKHCAKQYFDCADHTLILTDVSVREHLVAAGFEIVSAHPRYIPFSFRSRLPDSAPLVALYLRLPIFWRVLGKQFLIVATPR